MMASHFLLPGKPRLERAIISIAAAISIAGAGTTIRPRAGGP